MNKRIIDLTITIEEGMQIFAAPWHPAVEVKQLGRHGVENRETRRLVLGTHTGTHMDAPRHFIEGGSTAEQMPLETLVGPATVVDLTWAEEFQEVSLEKLTDALHGRALKRLILHYGWDAHLGGEEYFTNHAFLSEQACQYLVRNGCRLLAMDTPQPDNPKNCRGSKNDAPNHKILLGGGVILVEYLVNLAEITQPVVELVVAPLKIKGGDGAPARCFAVESVSGGLNGSM